MRCKSEKKGVVHMMSEGSVLPALPVRRPPIRPRPSAMIEPESPGGEDPRLVVIGKDSPLHRRLVSAIVEVLANKGKDAGGVAVQEARFTVVVEHIRVAYPVFLDDIPKFEAVLRILKGSVVASVRGHIFNVNSLSGIFVPGV